ncbi:MAG: DNA/RNA nuclease SfsA [Euryarchaeota archaeon]|nr:DNA/RNA nuclease SfsA [Euryarchaeota archaeon]
MRIRGELKRGRFLQRLNRFACLVEVSGRAMRAYLPNPGRLQELLVEGAEVLLRRGGAAGRKTTCDLIGVKAGETWVSIDARVPNALFKEAMELGSLREFAGYRVAREEVKFGESRLDFLLQGEPPCLVEVKSCTLVEEGVARFPDAPTARGRRHLLELIKAKNAGYRCAVVFVIQRSDAFAFAPNDATDSAFGEALREAARRGVEVLAYRCRFDGREIEIAGRVEVLLG